MKPQLTVGKSYKRTTKYGELLAIITVNNITLNYHQSLVDAGIIYEETLT